LAEDPLVGELVKELSKRYDERQMAQSGLRKDNPKLERLDRKIRALRTNLQFINPGVPKQCLTITSSISGEGKTFISINMASVLALGGKKVVLLGVVLRKPKIFNDFGLTNNADLTTYLIGKHSIQEIIQPTGKGTLDLIAAGPIPPNPSELLLDAKFGELIA